MRTVASFRPAQCDQSGSPPSRRSADRAHENSPVVAFLGYTSYSSAFNGRIFTNHLYGVLSDIGEAYYVRCTSLAPAAFQGSEERGADVLEQVFRQYATEHARRVAIPCHAQGRARLGEAVPFRQHDPGAIIVKAKESLCVGWNRGGLTAVRPTSD